MEFIFFKTDNKSGYKTRENWLKKNYPEDYEKIMTFSKGIDCSFKERIWFYFNNTTQRPRCANCDTELKFNGRFDDPYSEFCSIECFNNNKEEIIKRQTRATKEKYGVDYYPQHKDFIKKLKNTKLNRYGDENFVNPQKSKETRKLKYDNENYTNHEKYKLTCQKKYGSDNYSKSTHFRNLININYKKIYPNLNFVEIKKGLAVIHCDKCNQTYEITKQLIYERDKRNYEVCTNCNPIGNLNRSGYEHEISSFLTEKNIEVITNYKIPNTKKEIDIFLPKYNIGIEFDGLYWHSELFKTDNYHLEKTIAAKEHGIELIHIFEDEWVYKSEIVKSIILNKLKYITSRVNGRKCIIKEVNSSDCKKFLEENHIQGNVKSSIRLGLYHENELVSLMSFSKGRIIMGGKNDEYELNRFCNKINTIVNGSFAKLLKHFITNYNPLELVSYSDLRYFNGTIYEKNNFKFIHQTKPNYWYVVGDLRHHRFNFNKKRLIKEGYNPNKSEKEIMFERKYYRIYDCGNIRWVYNLQKNE